MNYLLTGAEFNNKGAEAMTLVALNNIYKNDPSAKVYIIRYSTTTVPFKLKRELIQFDVASWQIEALLRNGDHTFLIDRIKDFIKFFVPGRISYLGKTKEAKRILQSIDVMIDISGFSFSSKWGDKDTVEFVNKIYLLKKYGAKVFLMPQSFGPFDYKKKKVLEYAKNAVALCEKVYAREKEGYDLLKKLGLNNVEYCPDSVLIEKDFDPANVIEDYDLKKEKKDITNKHSIAIVPNYRLIDRGGFNNDRLMEFYYEAIKKVIEDFHVYLIAHSGEDLVLCKKIKEKYMDDPKVVLIDHVMLSFNYESFVSNMDFIIASRYHAIIHSYKRHVPAVILGWAEKYHDISKLMGQEKLLININKINDSLATIEYMKKNYEREKEMVKNVLYEVQRKICYDHNMFV